MYPFVEATEQIEEDDKDDEDPAQDADDQEDCVSSTNCQNVTIFDMAVGVSTDCPCNKYSEL